MRSPRGFTLIELLAVLAILGLLLALAAPKYFRSVDAAKEAVLAENLRTARQAIDHFYADRGRYPESLDELVSRRYLRTVPIDPLAVPAAGWTLVMTSGEMPGIMDLRSRATGNGRNGIPYGKW